MSAMPRGVRPPLCICAIQRRTWWACTCSSDTPASCAKACKRFKSSVYKATVRSANPCGDAAKLRVVVTQSGADKMIATYGLKGKSWTLCKVGTAV